LRFDLPCVREQRHAARREGHAARTALEQRDSALPFQLAHALGERRLAHRQLACRRAQVAGPRNGEKRAQQSGVAQ
jgi:hypothetical protein